MFCVQIKGNLIYKYIGMGMMLTATAISAVPKRALITGITGQDGSYLAEFLLEKGYEVHGTKRRASLLNTQRIDHLFAQMNGTYKGRFFVHYADMTDATNLLRLVQEIRPDEVYNLAAQSHVQVSFELPEYTAQADALGTLRLLEALRIAGLTNTVRFYQASTSELFGKVQQIPQNEETPFYPRSPYAVAKLYAYWITINYREAYSMFACNGILFNHESPLRGETFVTRKITRAVTRIYHNMQEVLYLGNLDAMRDWGYAKEYVQVMWRMLQLDTPYDLVIATGQTHSVREFVQEAFAHVGITIEWEGSGVDEKGYDAATGKLLVAIDPKYFRPSEVELLIGDSRKAQELLGWQPQTTFKELVALMVEADMDELSSIYSQDYNQKSIAVHAP